MQYLYLAGPEVFLPEPFCSELAHAKKLICDQYECVGLYPTDALPADIFSDNYSKQEQSHLVRQACIDAMHKADAVIANITPFRGPSADAGTVFEIGYMSGLGKPVYMYSNKPDVYITKVDRARSGKDDMGMTVEDFGMVDNLMFGLTTAFDGFDTVENTLQGLALFTDTEAFEKSVRRLVSNSRLHLPHRARLAG